MTGRVIRVLFAVEVSRFSSGTHVQSTDNVFLTDTDLGHQFLAIPARAVVFQIVGRQPRVTKMSMSSIWDQVAVLIAARTTRFTFSTWFKPVKFSSDDGVALRLLVPNGLFREWFLTHYSPIVEQTLGGART